MHRLTKWLNKVVNIGLIFFMLLINVTAVSQNTDMLTLDKAAILTLDKAYDLAKQNYPLIRQKQLIEKSSFLTVENVRTSLLPQLSVNGQVTYQSDVINIPISIPNVKIDPLSKDQYKIWADVNQLIYDGGITKAQQSLQEAGTKVDEQKLEVELYKLKDRISQLYLGILLLDAQLKQVDLVKSDIETGLKSVQAQVNNGTAFKSGVLVLQAQLLQTDQRAIELSANRKGLIDVLGLFVNQSLPETIQLQMPVVKEMILNTTIHRPELQLYSYQDDFLKTQHQLITAKNLPKASLFVQGGYGKPGLNQLMNEFSLYSIGGVRLNWSLNGLYTVKRERQVVEVNQEINAVQKDVFLFNTAAQLKQQASDIQKLEKLIKADGQIISIREQIKVAANAQLENAVITSNDYLREVNAEDQARVTLITHQLQLLQAKINYQNTKGNQ